MKTRLRTLVVLLRKDVLVELRSREILFTMGIFALLLVVLFSFAFYTDVERARVYSPGILWITVLFAGTLGLNRLFERETTNGALDGLLLCPAGPRTVFVAKALAHLLFTSVMVALTLPLLVVFFHLEVPSPWALLGSLFAGMVGFCFVGTLFAAMLVGSRMREVLLPVVVYPLVVPLLIAGVKSSSGLLAGDMGAEVGGWIQFMIGFDILFVVLSTWLFDMMLVR
jgi:heme exporter protein B